MMVIEAIQIVGEGKGVKHDFAIGIAYKRNEKINA